MSTHITHEQKEIMFDFITARLKFYAEKFSPDFTQSQSRALWQELTVILNAHPNGAKKEWSAWRKSWIAIKKNCKSKLARQKKHQRGTGGGPPEPVTTDTFKSKVMEPTSPVCVTGNNEIPEPSIILDEEVIFEEIFSSCNPETEVVRNIELDHAYMDVTPQLNENIDPTELNKNENTRKNLISKVHTGLVGRGKPRVTKTMRLNESIKNHSKMLKISERAINETNTYRSEKLQILKEQRDEMKRQTQVMEDIYISLRSIIDRTLL